MASKGLNLEQLVETLKALTQQPAVYDLALVGSHAQHHVGHRLPCFIRLTFAPLLLQQSWMVSWVQKDMNLGLRLF